MHVKNYMEHAAAIQRSIGLPGTDYHLRGEYSQVFLRIQFRDHLSTRNVSVRRDCRIYKNRTTIWQGFTLVQKQTTSLFADIVVYLLNIQSRDNYKILCCKTLS